MTFTQRIGTALGTGALIVSMVTPAFADTSIKVNDNGQNSTNNVEVNKSVNSTVNQTNNTTNTVIVGTVSSTGGNKANGNNGGDVTVKSGDATAKTVLKIDGSSNHYDADDCGCPEGDLDITVKGNAQKSDNNVSYDNSNKKSVKQDNKSKNTVIAGTEAKTGYNKASHNNGKDSNVKVTSGDASSKTKVAIKASSNKVK